MGLKRVGRQYTPPFAQLQTQPRLRPRSTAPCARSPPSCHAPAKPRPIFGAVQGQVGRPNFMSAACLGKRQTDSSRLPAPFHQCWGHLPPNYNSKTGTDFVMPGKHSTTLSRLTHQGPNPIPFPSASVAMPTGCVLQWGSNHRGLLTVGEGLLPYHRC